MSRKDRPGPSVGLVVPVVLLLSLAPLASPLGGQTCSVPGSHATIQAAVNDLACLTIDLAAQTYTESVYIPRALALQGPGTASALIEGLLEVVGAGTQVTLLDLEVRNGCSPEAMRVTAGAQVEAMGFEVTRVAALPCPPVVNALVFTDGFESGDSSAWSRTVP